MTFEQAATPLPRLISRLRATTFLVGAGSLMIAHPALANPQGGVVVGGQASITAAPGVVTIDQSSKTAIVDWSSFNIGRGETTRFNQPDASSTAVNRIGGNAPSVVLGNLSANGRVVLINGNGLVFGAGAKVNVGSLIATTHDASNTDLMSGKAVFDKAGSPTASITNNGEIVATSGMVGLVAPAVINNGTILARVGGVVLGAAHRFTLDFTGDGLISFPVDAQVLSRALDANGKPVDALVANNGRIEGGTVLLTAQAAKGVVENAISMGGLVRAASVHEAAGSIVLDGGSGAVSATGTLDASNMAAGAAGGSITVLGDTVTVGAGALLDASGDAGGGQILVGGDFHGAGADRNASNSLVLTGAVLKADAVTHGVGGRIAVWADGATIFGGVISARGGAQSGNGGFVETSGKQSLTVADGATVNTLAPHGRAGDWLLDPANITVAATGSGSLAQGADTSDSSSSVTISAATINAATSNVILAADNSITVNSDISIGQSGVGITFQGPGDGLGVNAGVTLNANVGTNGGAVTIWGKTIAGADVTIDTGQASVALANGSSVEQNLVVGGSDTAGAVAFGGNAVLGGDLAVTAGTGGLSFNGTVDGGSHALTIDAAGATTFSWDVTNLSGFTTGTGGTTFDNAALSVDGATVLGGDLTLNSNGYDVNFNGAVDGAHGLNILASNVTFGGNVGGTAPLASVLVDATTTLKGNVTTNNGAIEFRNALALDGTNGSMITLASGSGAVKLVAPVNSASSSSIHGLTVTSSGAVTLGGIGPTQALSSVTVSATPTTLNGAKLITTGDINLNGAVTLAKSVSVDAGSGVVDFASTVDGAWTLKVNTSHGVTFGGAVGATRALGAVTTTGGGLTTLDGNVTLNNSAMNIGAGLTLGSDVTINPGNGTVTVTGAVNGGSHKLTLGGSGLFKFNGGVAGLTGFTTGTGAVTVTGGFTVNGATVLNKNLAITAGSSDVAFNGTVDGGQALSVTGTGGLTFGGAVGATTALASLSTGTGLTTLSGDIKTSGGAVTINGATALTGDSIINTGAGNVTFSGAVDGAHALNVTTTGATIISSTVGATTSLTSLATGSGAVTLTGNVSTTNGAVQIKGAATLGGDVTIAAGTGAVSFTGPVNGPHGLTVSNSGGLVFGGAVGATTALTGLSTGTGLTTIADDITTAGLQSYGGAVLLAGDVTLKTTNAAVSFTSTIDTASGAAKALTVTTGAGQQTYGGALGATRALGAVTLTSTNAAGVSLPGVGAFSSLDVTANGAVSATTSGALTLAGIDTKGAISVATQAGDLTIGGVVKTTSTSATALTLEAGSSSDRVASAGAVDTGGNVVIGPGGGLSIGAGGSGLIYTGSITGSTGLSSAVIAGNFRYWSDANGHTGYTTALATGIGAIYRDQPTATVTATAASSGRTYDGTTTAASVSVTGLLNGDTASAGGTVTVTDSNSASSTLLNAGSYTLGVTGATTSGGPASLGYAVQTSAATTTYVIKPVTLTLTGVKASDRTYDGTTAAALSNSGTLNGLVGLETLSITGATGVFADANAGVDKIVTITGATLGNGTGLASNYVLSPAPVTTTATISPARLTAGLTGSVTKTFDGSTAASLGAGNYILTGTIYGNDTVTLNNPTAGAYADANSGTGKTVSVAGLKLSNPNYVLASATVSAAIGVINPAAETTTPPPPATGPTVPPTPPDSPASALPPPIIVIGLTSTTSAVSAATMAANLTTPTGPVLTQFAPPPSNLVEVLYTDVDNVIGGASASAPAAGAGAAQPQDDRDGR